MKKPFVSLTLTVTLVAAAACGEAITQNVLTLEEALRLAAERNPGLRAAQAGVRAADGLLVQAGTVPNPAAAFEAEDFGGSREKRGFDSGQTTASLEQPLELGGKRAARRQAAAAALRLTERERDALRLDVIQETTERFIDVLAAQEELSLSKEARQTAESIHQTVSNRVAAGKDSPVEEAKARAELALACVAVDRAKSRLAQSRTALCAEWGDATPLFDSARGSLSQIPGAAPGFGPLADAMTRSPDWARWPDDIRAAELEVESARRSRIPDVSVGAGIRQSQADDTVSFVATLGMELPVFDRRRGSILAARAELDRRQAEREAACSALRSELAQAHESLTAAVNAAATIARDALPAAEQAFAAAQASYAGGKISYLDIQDARRSLVDMRRQQLEILAEYHRAVARVERLAGTSLAALAKN